MSMTVLSLREFLNGYEKGCYPEGFLADYEPVECLAHNAQGETLLVRNKDGLLFVAKCYVKSEPYSKTGESALLRGLKHEGLPAFAGEYEDDETRVVVREYMLGEPLDQLDVPLAHNEVIAIGIRLCDLLDCLHGQKPPVIHRDIKPQNIILNEKGNISLIDFGISRAYDETAREDTVCMGTRAFAPPEQFGFAQTDARSDLYSLGVVFYWLLTGSTDVKRAEAGDSRLMRIICKCTAFTPEKRYASAVRLRRALLRADGHVRRKTVRALALVLSFFVVLAGGFALGRFTELSPALLWNGAYATFSEPLIEEAVRLQLGKAEGEPIFPEELDRVEGLYIYGDRIASSLEDFNQLRSKVDSGEIEGNLGSISTLEDIAKLRNLRQLYIGNQDIADLSALSVLEGLECLGLFNCPVSDISVVEGMKELTQFSLNDCPDVTDLSPLAGCAKLSELVLVNCGARDYSVLASLGDFNFIHMIGIDTELYLPYLEGKSVRELKLIASGLSTIAQLKGIEGLKVLILEDMDLDSLAGVGELPSLTEMTLADMRWLDLAPLTELASLQTLTLSEDMRAAGEAIRSAARFDIQYR